MRFPPASRRSPGMAARSGGRRPAAASTSRARRPARAGASCGSRWRADPLAGRVAPRYSLRFHRDAARERRADARTETSERAMSPRKNPHIRGPRISPPAITGQETAADLIDRAFLAYNGARLREGARLLTERMLADDVTVALSLTGALTPAGLGMSAIIPLIEAGFVDWIVSTGANLYHDAHFGIGLSMHAGTWQADDVDLRAKEVVRIYDIFFDYSVLLETDAFFRKLIGAEEFQRPMGTAEFHYRIGRYVNEREHLLKQRRKSL